MEKNRAERMTEEEYLAGYHPDDYERPAVAVDMLIFTMSKEQRLQILLIRRGAHPFFGKWALPGGFVRPDESLEAAAVRELWEETGFRGVYLEQLYTFGDLERDKRMRVISVAYFALVPARLLEFKAGDDAGDACLFEIRREGTDILLYSSERNLKVSGAELAFDHIYILQTALERLRGKVKYSDIALELLRDKEKFSIYELQLIYEAVTGEKSDSANFRRSFKRKYLDTGRAEKLEEKCFEYSRKPSSYYRLPGSVKNRPPVV